MNGPPNDTRPEHTLMGRVLRQRELAEQGTGRGVLAAYRTLVHAATEAQGRAYSEAVLAGLRPVQKLGARRAAGLAATHSSVRHSPKIPFGTAARLLHARAHNGWPGDIDSSGALKANALTSQVNSLLLLDLEQAVVVFDAVLARFPAAGTRVDFHDIAHTLTHWGNGLDQRSDQIRNQVIADFYGAADWRLNSAEDTNTPPPTDSEGTSS